MSRKQKNKPHPESRGRKGTATAARVDLPKVASPAPAPIGREDDPADGSFGWRDWLFAATLVVAVFLVYQPAWRGGLIWDDDAHVTRPSLQSWHGLGRIWFDIRATQQYYPLLHSAFWFEHRLWGNTTLGYHLVNISLHAMAALLVLLLLRRLKIPGACLAAAIFALHPVQVESVAWITELKNTLSGVLYLVAMLSYLRFDRTRGKWWYGLALVLFVLGLLSKTVTATLPAALLVIFWWQRGRLSWKTDALPLLPFFVLGAAAGAFTAWVERTLIGAEGEEFTFTVVERGLIAGRAIWFYLGKLFWPVDLEFIYRRWHIDQAEWWQYLYPAAAAMLLLALWKLRHRTRSPLAATLFFVGTLFPVLGFLNVYPFIFSFVADHFQYLASLGIITLFSAGVALLLERAKGWGKMIGQIGCLALLAVLAVLTWRQSRMYADVDKLYRTTIERNPDCWMAYNNLGLVLAGRGQVNEAIDYYQRALEIKPDDAEAYSNLGLALAGRGQIEEAIANYGKALKIRPDLASAHVNLGLALAGRGLVEDAIAHYRVALASKPDYVEAHNNLGLALASRGELDDAITHYRKALEIQPDSFEAHSNLGAALARRGEVDEGIAHYRTALEIQPDSAEAHFNLGNLLAGRGDVDEAVAQYSTALEIKPDYVEAHNNLGLALSGRGRFDDAITQFRKALAIRPNFGDAHDNLGIALARSGRIDEAIPHFTSALNIDPKNAQAHLNLGIALASLGQFDEARGHYQKALALASAHNDAALAELIRAKIGLLPTLAPAGNRP